MIHCIFARRQQAVIAQLGERKTEDLKVSGSIPDDGNSFASVDVSCYFEPLLSAQQIVCLILLKWDVFSTNSSYTLHEEYNNYQGSFQL
jgi:hypothetical protein